MSEVPIAPKPLARLRTAWSAFLVSKSHFEDLLNAVGETMGIDVEEPGVGVELDRGVFTIPQREGEVNGASVDDHRLDDGSYVSELVRAN